MEASLTRGVRVGRRGGLAFTDMDSNSGMGRSASWLRDGVCRTLGIASLDFAFSLPPLKQEGVAPRRPEKQTRNKNKQVKTSLQGRIRIAWLLLATLMPFFAVKALHHHEAYSSAICQTTADAGQPQTPCDDNCPICHFSLEPFTPGESPALGVIYAYTPCERGLLSAPLHGRHAATTHLRGPPSC